MTGVGAGIRPSSDGRQRALEERRRRLEAEEAHQPVQPVQPSDGIAPGDAGVADAEAEARPELREREEPTGPRVTDPEVREAKEAERRHDSALVARRGQLEAAVGASTLRTEVLGDGEENCLEHAAEMARPEKDELVFLDDRRAVADGDANGAGHVLVRDRASGHVWDPNDGDAPANPQAWPHRSVESWVASQGSAADGGPAYAVDAVLRADRVQSVLTMDPAERAAAIEADPALAAIADNRYADGPAAADGPPMLSEAIPADERPDFARIDAWVEAQGTNFFADEAFEVLAGNSELGELSDAERTRVMDRATALWNEGGLVVRRAEQLVAQEASRHSPELREFVTQDLTARALATAERGYPHEDLGSRYATAAALGLREAPAEERRAFVEGLGEDAPRFVGALQLDRLQVPGGAPEPGARHLAAASLLDALGTGEVTEATQAFTSTAFATLTPDAFRGYTGVPGMPATMGRALGHQLHPEDPELAAREGERFAGVLGTEAGQDFLLGSDVLGVRAENLALLRENPDWDAELFRGAESPYDIPEIMTTRAAPRATAFVEGRGDEPVVLAGTDLDNTVGFAMGYPPQGIDENESEEDRLAREAAVARGEHSYYEGEPAEAAVGPVVQAIRDIGGPDAEVTVLPIQYASTETGAVDLPLFRVRDERTGEDRFVDNEGRDYDSFEAWLQENHLPPGNVTYPADGRLTAGADGAPELVSENTVRTVDTPGDHVRQFVDRAALVGGTIAGGAILIGSGGTVALVAAGGASAWGAYGFAEGLVDRAQHGQSIALNNADARNQWLGLGASLLGVSGLGATAVAGQLARTGNSFARPAATLAGGLNVSGVVADGAVTADAGIQLATRWDELSGGERANLALQIGFFGVSSMRGGVQSGGRIRDMFDATAQQRRLLENDPILAGTADPIAQARRLGNLDPDLLTQVRARAGELSGDDALRYNQLLERRLYESGPYNSPQLMRTFAEADPQALLQAYRRADGLPAAEGRQFMHSLDNALRHAPPGSVADTLHLYRTLAPENARSLNSFLNQHARGHRAETLAVLARAEADPNVRGVDDWVRFSTAPVRNTSAETTDTFRDRLNELRVAQGLVPTLRPGEVIHVGGDANPRLRPDGGALPSTDITITGPHGTRNIEVQTPAAHPTIRVLNRAVAHAGSKRPGLDEGEMPEAAVVIPWPLRPTDADNGSVHHYDELGNVLSVNGTTATRVGNYFENYLNALNGNPSRLPPNLQDVGVITLHAPDGRPIHQFTRPRDGDHWGPWERESLL